MVAGTRPGGGRADRPARARRALRRGFDPAPGVAEDVPRRGGAGGVGVLAGAVGRLPAPGVRRRDPAVLRAAVTAASRARSVVLVTLVALRAGRGRHAARPRGRRGGHHRCAHRGGSGGGGTPAPTGAAQTQALVELTHELAAERRRAEEAAVGAERARIAQELHDVVGHEVTLMAIQAEAAAAALRSRRSVSRNRWRPSGPPPTARSPRSGRSSRCWPPRAGRPAERRGPRVHRAAGAGCRDPR